MSEHRKRFSDIRLSPLYYRLRKNLGLEEIPAERRRRQKRLFPEQDAEKALREEDERRLRLGALCLAGAVLVTVLCALTQRGADQITLTRPGYGEDDGEVSLSVEYGSRNLQIPLGIPSLQYTDEEWERVREEAWEAAQQRALAENEDWDAVTGDLDFSGETGVAGVSVEWSSEDADWISYEGKVGDRTELTQERKVQLGATLICGTRRWNVSRTAVVLPAVLSGEEEEEKDLRRFLQAKADGEESGQILLPGSYQGKEIRYLDSDALPLWIFLLLGGMAAAAFWYLPEQRRRENEKSRERELTLAYPELVNSLTVLMGAGLTVRGAWEKMTEGYRQERAEGGRRRVLYEEMLLTTHSLGQGTYEEAAYVSFGRRCGGRPYLRLGSLLETNLKKGNRGLIPLLKEESEGAMEERLQLAKRLGEEASTKLLFPMLILFALVLVLLIVPAFWSF